MTRRNSSWAKSWAKWADDHRAGVEAGREKLVGRDGIEPPTPGFSGLSLGSANDAEVWASSAMVDPPSLCPSIPKWSWMVSTGTHFGHTRRRGRTQAYQARRHPGDPQTRDPGEPRLK